MLQESAPVHALAGRPGRWRLLSRIFAVETNPHPDPLPFAKGEGNLRWHRVRVTEQGSEKCAPSSPRSERGEDQDEGRFRLHTHGSVCAGLQATVIARSR